MALDHSRLGLENIFLENKSGRIFCIRQVYFTVSCQQVWGRVNQRFILFIHHTWGETVPWGAVFIINAVFHNFAFFIQIALIQYLGTDRLLRPGGGGDGGFQKSVVYENRTPLK